MMTQIRASIAAAVWTVAWLLTLLGAGCGTREASVPAISETRPPTEIGRMIERFAPTEVTADLTGLTPADQQVLGALIAAAKIIDALYLGQVWVGNPALLIDLARDATLEGRERLHYFLINKGPWSRLDDDRPFIPGVPTKPEGANFYPAGATREEIDRWIRGLSPVERSRATGFFTAIRRDSSGRLTAVPYNVAYQTELARLAELLHEAAAAAEEPTLKAYLSKRAEAFLSNDYYDSDVAWMELESLVEPTIGPYEVYEDGYFNYKAAFEAFITIRDREESARLARFSGELQEIEDHLPIAAAYRNPSLGALAPIVVVNEIYAAGDANRGVQTAAFNLPNDERVTREKGSKRVMLKNVQEAKFAKTLTPIARVVLAPGDQDAVSFEAFFTHILMHELMHGLGPHTIVVGGRQTTVRQEMRDASSFLEEAKADISGLWALQYLIDQGVVDRSLERPLYTTFLASCFRSIRFGINEAHGKGIAIQLNYLLDQGGFSANGDGTFAVDHQRVKEGVTALTREIMTMQAEGDYARAKDLGDRLGVLRPEVARALERLSGVPVDIEPRFTTAEELIDSLLRP